MAKNGARGGVASESAGRLPLVKSPRNGLWTRRESSEGRFKAMKAKGGSFKGVQREK